MSSSGGIKVVTSLFQNRRYQNRQRINTKDLLHDSHQTHNMPAVNVRPVNNERYLSLLWIIFLLLFKDLNLSAMFNWLKSVDGELSTTSFELEGVVCWKKFWNWFNKRGRLLSGALFLRRRFASIIFVTTDSYSHPPYYHMSLYVCYWAMCCAYQVYVCFVVLY
jgi:hypothetical protein